MTDTPSGLGIDSSGGPVIDPTANVLQLVEAAIQRQDDLRAAEFKRQDDLRVAESRHLREIAELRAKFGGEIRAAEAARIDAIRTIDVGAVTRASEAAAVQATTLASQVTQSAEAMRTQVAAAAQAAAIALEASLKPIQIDIADLRRAQYEAQGQKTQVVETQQRGLTASQWLLVGIATFSVFIALLTLIVTIAAIATSGFTK